MRIFRCWHQMFIPRPKRRTDPPRTKPGIGPPVGCGSGEGLYVDIGYPYYTRMPTCQRTPGGALFGFGRLRDESAKKIVVLDYVQSSKDYSHVRPSVCRILQCISFSPVHFFPFSPWRRPSDPGHARRNICWPWHASRRWHRQQAPTTRPPSSPSSLRHSGSWSSTSASHPRARCCKSSGRPAPGSRSSLTAPGSTPVLV